MQKKEWKSNIQTLETDDSFLLGIKKGSFLPVFAFCIVCLPVFYLLFVGLKWVVTSDFLVEFPVIGILWTCFLLAPIIGFSYAFRLMLPKDKRTYLDFINGQMSYQYYHFGKILVEHPIKNIHKISLTTNKQYLIIHLYDNKVIQEIDIKIEYAKEAREIYLLLTSFLRKQGIAID